MPSGFADIHEYDGRASVSTKRGTPVRYGSLVYSLPSMTPDPHQKWSPVKSEVLEDPLGASYMTFLDKADVKENDEDHDPTIPNSTEFNCIQHLSGLPRGSRDSDGRSAVRQSSRDRGRNRDRKRSRSPGRSRSPFRSRDLSQGADLNPRSRSPSHRSSRRDSVSSVFSWTQSSPTDPENICTCPVSYDCLARQSSNLLDCRTLVLEQKLWRERSNEEAHNLLAAMPPEDAPFIKEDRVRDLENYLNTHQALSSKSRALNKLIGRISEWVAEVRSSNITQQVLDESQVLDTLDAFLAVGNAQTRVERHFPRTLEEELTITLRKWKRGDLGCDPNRGLTRNLTVDQNGTPERTTYVLDPDWEHYISADFYGEGHLVNGQVFYSRTQLMRDGVHSAKIAGISGTVKKGARSIVMGYHDDNKKDYYADIDMGDTIDYMGTALAPKEDSNDQKTTNEPDERMDRRFNGDRQPTACTRMLMTSFQTGTPVRLIRSPHLARQVTNRPEKCFRYDGLYKVVKMTPLKLERQIWSFRLTRLSGQGPLRGFSDGETQPSSRGKRYGYARYRANKYPGRLQTGDQA